MIYLLITIFFIQAIITLKLFLLIDEFSKSKKYWFLKVLSLITVSAGIFILITGYLL